MTGEVAIAHGQLTSDGGAERVAIELARTFDAPIYSHDVDPGFVPGDVDARELPTSPLSTLIEKTPLPHTLYWLGKHLNDIQESQHIEALYDYDVVIQSKPEMSWWVPRTDQTVVRYLHHPQRAHYDQFHRKGQSLISRCWSAAYRTLHRQTIDYPDLIVCNSEVTERRVRRYWRVDRSRLTTVYPGVRVEDMASDAAETRDYYLYLGRLAQNKRIDLIADIARGTDREIVVAGDGSERHHLEDCEADNLRVLGYVDEATKRRLLSEARALLFTGEEEDFGIVPVEALASGTPVIGVDEGFTPHQINHSKNGLLVEPSVSAFCEGIETVETDGVEWEPWEIEATVQQFGFERFREEMQAAVADAETRSQPDIQPVERPQVAVSTDGGEVND